MHSSGTLSEAPSIDDTAHVKRPILMLAQLALLDEDILHVYRLVLRSDQPTLAAGYTHGNRRWN
jgi:hypothetical protein